MEHEEARRGMRVFIEEEFGLPFSELLAEVPEVIGFDVFAGISEDDVALILAVSRLLHKRFAASQDSVENMPRVEVPVS